MQGAVVASCALVGTVRLVGEKAQDTVERSILALLQNPLATPSPPPRQVRKSEGFRVDRGSDLRERPSLR